MAILTDRDRPAAAEEDAAEEPPSSALPSSTELSAFSLSPTLPLRVLFPAAEEEEGANPAVPDEAANSAPGDEG